VTPVVAAALSRPAAAELNRVAGVFDQYRQHYGEPAVPGQTLAWLATQLDHERLTVFTAYLGGELAGVATTVQLPASLRLSCSWQLRDLYVVPAARRAGAARALLGAVRAAATAAGAIRLSVQAEPGNTAALQLYYSSSFLPVDDLQVLALPLHHDGA
jgi:GNAT superfamily N-acetyltransferase